MNTKELKGDVQRRRLKRAQRKVVRVTRHCAGVPRRGDELACARAACCRAFFAFERVRARSELRAVELWFAEWMPASLESFEDTADTLDV